MIRGSDWAADRIVPVAVRALAGGEPIPLRNPAATMPWQHVPGVGPVLQINKAHHQLGCQPRWDFATTLACTMAWNRAVHEGASPLACCLADLEAYAGCERSPA